MTIGYQKNVGQIIVTDKNGEIIAVISDKEIIEKEGYKVAIDYLT